MSESEYEDGSGDDGQAMETDSFEDLRVRRRKSAALFHIVQDGLQNIQACSGHDRAWHVATLSSK
jgi:hypothetical protein